VPVRQLGKFLADQRGCEVVQALGAGEGIVLLSGDQTADIDGAFRWSEINVWNNDGDEAFLLGADGAVVGSRRCTT